jgi:hypothetical protein
MRKTVNKRGLLGYLVQDAAALYPAKPDAQAWRQIRLAAALKIATGSVATVIFLYALTLRDRGVGTRALAAALAMLSLIYVWGFTMSFVRYAKANKGVSSHG